MWICEFNQHWKLAQCFVFHYIVFFNFMVMKSRMWQELSPKSHLRTSCHGSFQKFALSSKWNSTPCLLKAWSLGQCHGLPMIFLPTVVVNLPLRPLPRIPYNCLAFLFVGNVEQHEAWNLGMYILSIRPNLWLHWWTHRPKVVDSWECHKRWGSDTSVKSQHMQISPEAVLQMFWDWLATVLRLFGDFHYVSLSIVKSQKFWACPKL